MLNVIWVYQFWVKFISMNKFVDTHSHGIPQVDDGVQSDESALIFLQQAAQSKIGLIFMTPHVMYQGKFFPSKALLEEKMSQLRGVIAEHKLDLRIKLGCEILVTKETLPYLYQGDYWGYQDTDYVLIEFLPPFEETLIQEAIYELKRQGKNVIIAHPERYFNDPKIAIQRVSVWKQERVYLQVNKTSLFSAQKASTRRVALALLQANLIAMVATDAHHAPGRRECILDKTYIELTRLFDQKTASLLVSDNPSLLSENKPMISTTIPNGPLTKIRCYFQFKNAPKP